MCFSLVAVLTANTRFLFMGDNTTRGKSSDGVVIAR